MTEGPLHSAGEFGRESEMAKVWFVRRRGAEWIVPGGVPAHEAPFAEVIFKLDVAPQRWLSWERPALASELPREAPDRLNKVMIETTTEDLAGQDFTTYKVGFYDSPYPPIEAARRLGLQVG